MKRTNLIEKLLAMGATTKHKGSGHEKWLSKNGYPFTVPRHTEIDEIMVKVILKQASK